MNQALTTASLTLLKLELILIDIGHHVVRSNAKETATETGSRDRKAQEKQMLLVFLFLFAKSLVCCMKKEGPGRKVGKCVLLANNSLTSVFFFCFVFLDIHITRHGRRHAAPNATQKSHQRRNFTKYESPLGRGALQQISHYPFNKHWNSVIL